MHLLNTQLFFIFCCALLVCTSCFERNSTSNVTEVVDLLSTKSTTVESDHEEAQESNVHKIVSGLKGLWKDFYKRHFADKYQKLEDFFSSSKKELTEKVDDTQKYIASVEERQRYLLETAKNNTKQKAQDVSNTLGTWLSDVTTFKERLANSAKSQYDDLKTEWETSMTNKWNNGLDNIIDLSRKAKVENENLGLITSLNQTVVF